MNSIIKSSLRNIKTAQNVFKHFRVVSRASTIDIRDLQRFSALSKEWWDLEGEFKMLHTMNRLRVPFIRDRLEKKPDAQFHTPLQGLRLLDVGSGGGLLSEPLSRLGANVVGLDASEENVETARYHQTPDLSNLTYTHSSLEDFAESEEGLFDGVVLSEVVEHVNNLPHFMHLACSLVKPGGSLFVTTINKTQLSYWTAIFIAEKVLKLVPDGIHDWNKFVTPDELQQLLLQNQMSTRLVQGMCVNPLTSRWSWFADHSVNYALHAVKDTTVHS